MTWTPAPNYRAALKLGMNGVDVWALQWNLREDGFGLTPDGAFGPVTDRAARGVQTKENLAVDGVCGPATMRALCLTLSEPSTSAHRLPNGLLKGMMANESGFIIPAYSRHPSDAGFDLGPYQQSILPGQGSDPIYAAAYNAKSMADLTGQKMRVVKDQFRVARHVSTDKRAWELAALNHNWPFAAQNLANFGSIYPDPVRDNEPQQWIITASGGRLSTPAQWCEFYIQKTLVFCTTFPA